MDDPNELFRQAILDSLPAHIAVIDADGIVIAVNRSWTRFAEQNGLSDARTVCAGADYLEVCRAAMDNNEPLAHEALTRIEAVLAGSTDTCSMEYPCHSPTQQRYFLMNVIRPCHGIEGAVITHLDITERRRMEDEIRELNASLAAHAAELEHANREMETFNYSVTHDLRKPLTVINGYCQVILELFGNSLEEECRTYIQRVYEGTVRMDKLIDAQLKFSTASRTELHIEAVDLSSIAEAVSAELRLADPERRVECTIAGNLVVSGDRNLLRAVLENLLGNAWKFSGLREIPHIEFGRMKLAGEPVYFVRDNGAGFDMADADKLFEPFQRLNGTSDYAGHGIGLATVERIIHRHRGRVWAESEPDKGATFYFTVPG